jgi:hypothetical protein
MRRNPIAAVKSVAADTNAAKQKGNILLAVCTCGIACTWAYVRGKL